MAFTITAESTPVYNNFWDLFNPFNEDSDYWDCQDLITWHKALKQKWELDEANRIFIKAFELAPTGANAIDCRSVNAAFKDYAKDQGFYNALFSGVGGLLATGISAGQTVIDAAGNVIENTANTAKKASEYLPYIAALLIILSLIAIITIGASKTKKLAA